MPEQAAISLYSEVTRLITTQRERARSPLPEINGAQVIVHQPYSFIPHQVAGTSNSERLRQIKAGMLALAKEAIAKRGNVPTPINTNIKTIGGRGNWINLKMVVTFASKK